MENNQVTWTAQDGKAVVVTINERSTMVQVAGKIVANLMGDPYSPVPAKAAAQAAKMGVVAIIGPVAVTAERKALIEAKRAELFPPKAPAFRVPAELETLEWALEDARAWVLRHDANPAPAYAARDKAEKALAAWVAANPDAYAQVKAHRQAERDAKDAAMQHAVDRAVRGED